MAAHRTDRRHPCPVHPGKRLWETRIDPAETWPPRAGKTSAKCREAPGKTACTRTGEAPPSGVIRPRPAMHPEPHPAVRQPGERCIGCHINAHWLSLRSAAIPHYNPGLIPMRSGASPHQPATPWRTTVPRQRPSGRPKGSGSADNLPFSPPFPSRRITPMARNTSAKHKCGGNDKKRRLLNRKNQNKAAR